MAISEMIRMYAHDGIGDELEVVATSGLALFSDDPGCRRVQLLRGHDDRSCFVLHVTWESADAHAAWAATDALTRWRSLIGELRDERTEALGDFVVVAGR